MTVKRLKSINTPFTWIAGIVLILVSLFVAGWVRSTMVPGSMVASLIRNSHALQLERLRVYARDMHSMHEDWASQKIEAHKLLASSGDVLEASISEFMGKGITRFIVYPDGGFAGISANTRMEFEPAQGEPVVYYDKFEVHGQEPIPGVVYREVIPNLDGKEMTIELVIKASDE